MKIERTNPMKTTRQFFLSSLLFSFLALNVYAQTGWISTSSTNSDRSDANVFSANGFLYVLNGDGNYNQDYEYARINPDGTLSQWTIIQISPPIDNGINGISGTSVRTTFYDMGGEGTFTPGFGSPELYFINGAAKASSSVAGPLSSFLGQPFSMTTAQAYCTAVYSNGYLYAIGGEYCSAPQENGTCDGTGPTNIVEYCKVSTDGSLGPWQNTNPLSTTSGAMYGGWASNGYIFATGVGNYIEKAQQNSDGTLGPWQIVGQVPANGPVILTLNFQLYLISDIGSVYSTSFDPFTGTIGTWAQDTRPMVVPRGSFQQVYEVYPYIYVLDGADTTFSATNEVEYLTESFTPKTYYFPTAADTGRWVYESVSGTSTEPTVSWVSSYNGSTTGVLRIQFTQANQGVKMTLFKAGWFGSISTDWYEMKAQVRSDDTVYPNDLYAVGILYNGAYTPPMDISAHGLYSLASGWNYLYDFQQSYGGVSMYPQLTFKNNDVYPATMYLESVEIEPIADPR